MKYFLPLLFLAYWGGVTLFTHSHVVNGVVIVHSHPFKTGHQHTESQAETIFFLDHYVASSVPVLLVAVPCFCALLGLLVVLLLCPVGLAGCGAYVVPLPASAGRRHPSARPSRLCLLPLLT